MTNLIDRLLHIARRIDREDLGIDVKEIPSLRTALEDHRLAKEAELDELTDFETELDEIEMDLAAEEVGSDEGDSDADSTDTDPE